VEAVSSVLVSCSSRRLSCNSCLLKSVALKSVLVSKEADVTFMERMRTGPSCKSDTGVVGSNRRRRSRFMGSGQGGHRLGP